MTAKPFTAPETPMEREPFKTTIDVTIEPMDAPPSDWWRVIGPTGAFAVVRGDDLREHWNIEPPSVLHRVEVLLTDDVVRARGTTGAIRATDAYMAGSSALDAACAELVAELDADPERDALRCPGCHSTRRDYRRPYKPYLPHPGAVEKQYDGYLCTHEWHGPEPEPDEEPAAVLDRDGDVWVKVVAGGYRFAGGLRYRKHTVATEPFVGIGLNTITYRYGPLTPCEVPADLLPEPAVCLTCGSDDPAVCCRGRRVSPHPWSLNDPYCCEDSFHPKGDR